jgi:GlpG protein
LQYVNLTRKTSPAVLLPLITPIEELFLYELPPAVLWNDQLIRDYSYTDPKEIATLPAPAQELVRKIEENPPWRGFYGEFMAHLSHLPVAPYKLFSDIQKGEVWRLVTPIFLHANLLHILFNMLWLWMLGPVVEVRLGTMRYVALILLVALISNTLQYLVSGPFFMGFSGVICGIVGFIWMRQILSPLEVYPVQKGAIFFLWVFILGISLLQLLAFFLQVFNIVVLNLQIANTAHLSGALVGIVLARLRLFHPKSV